jgi:arylsulfatase A-like enzyme
MNRIRIGVASASLCGAIALIGVRYDAPTLAAEPPRPNIVFILADDLGAVDLGCFGSKYHKTPNLDRLATQGVRFTQAYAAAPVCSPTRAAIMTGKFPARLNLTDYLPGIGDLPAHKLLRPAINMELPATETTIAQILKKAGYATAHIGKWHLGGTDSGPLERGFDINIAGDQAGQPPSYFAPYRGKGKRDLPGLEQAPEGEYLTDRLTIEAEKFIDKHKDKPFFLYLPHFAVHTPLQAKADLTAKYQPGKAGSQGNPTYAAMLESLDDSIGRILKKLDELKLSDKTIVIFTSDNGGQCIVGGKDQPPTFNGPMREGKGFLYEGGIRVPLIVKWPGVSKAGTTAAEPAYSVDFFPTLLDACELKSDAKFDGISLAPLFKNESLKREALYWHYPHYHLGKPSGAIRAGDWKMIEFYENDRRELFDLKKDPGEGRNLSADRPELVKELAEKLAAWRTNVGAKMMKPNPIYTPNPQAGEGSILLHCKWAEVHGTMLRYEPLPHKNTLGYWVRAEDWASWEFTVTKPGKFTVEVLQGCGKGQGGSEVEVIVGEHKLTFAVEDTGHFQNFKARDIGTVTIEKPGRCTLNVKPKKKAAAAVMDVRSITLKPAK